MMNLRLTDFEETKDIVIEHARSMNKKPAAAKRRFEENSLLNNFFGEESTSE
ncbi:MAG: hypothetical protein KKE20_01350 [Nanoarchaeota archaeon]|nr:hypothetical protein [Nanoarchaeota archaeon]